MFGPPPELRIWRPIAGADLAAIEAMLRARDPFRGMRIPGFDWYSACQIVELSATFGTEFWLVLDRNVLSGLLRLRKGPHTVGDRERMVAAIMAFATAAGCYFDASIALAEGAEDGDEARWRDEALALAAAQNLHPQVYADIALGRSDRLDPAALASETTPEAVADVSDIVRPGRDRFRPEYGAALKLASLILSAMPALPTVDHMLEFLRWSYDDYMFLHGAIVYGSLALSPRRSGKMFKRVRTGDVTEALAGVKNATWDMGLLRDWSRRAAKDRVRGQYHLIASLDQAVLQCAEDLVIAAHSGADVMSTLQRRWSTEWGSVDGNRLIGTYRPYAIAHDTDGSRSVAKHCHEQAYWSDFVRSMEFRFAKQVARSSGRTGGS